MGQPRHLRFTALHRRRVEAGNREYEPTDSRPTRRPTLRRKVHQTISKVERDMSEFKWNTAVAALMTSAQRLERCDGAAAVSTDVVGRSDRCAASVAGTCCTARHRRAVASTWS